MKMRHALPLLAVLTITASIASAAIVQVNQTLEISGADWQAGSFADGTVTFTGVDGSPFNATFSTSANSNATVDGTGFHLLSVSGSGSAVQSGITGLRNTADFKDRVAWIEIDVTDFDATDGNLSTFLGTTAFGVEIPTSSGLSFVADGAGLVAFNAPVAASATGASGTFRFTTAPGVAFGQNSLATTTMYWNPGVIGNDLQISSIRFGIETLEAVPEPSASALLGVLGGLALIRRRR